VWSAADQWTRKRKLLILPRHLHLGKSDSRHVMTDRWRRKIVNLNCCLA
jgi:hypothetical protein